MQLAPQLFVVVAIASVLAWTQCRSFAPWVRRVALLSFAAHIGSAAIQILLVLQHYGGGDMVAYHSTGSEVASLLWRDFGSWADDALNLALGTAEARMPTTASLFAGSTTGSMIGISAWAHFLVGSDLLTVSIFFAAMSFFGKVALFRALTLVDASFERAAAIGCLLVPSAVFWSSGLLKEAVAIAGFGWLAYGVANLVRDWKQIRYQVPMLLGGLLVFLVKPYILMAFTCASMFWIASKYASRRSAVLRGRDVGLALAVAVLAVVAIGSLFPQFSFAELGSSFERLQTIGHRTVGGSSFALGGVGAGVPGQVALAPFALLTALFRPFPFEAGGNILVLIGSLETLVLLVLMLRPMLRRSVGWTARVVLRDSTLLYCATFVVVFGIAVGLASTNFGTLARYRIPLLPFFLLLLLTLNERSSAVQEDVACAA